MTRKFLTYVALTEDAVNFVVFDNVVLLQYLQSE